MVLGLCPPPTQYYQTVRRLAGRGHHGAADTFFLNRVYINWGAILGSGWSELPPVSAVGWREVGPRTFPP